MPVLIEDLRSCASATTRSSSRPTPAASSARAPTRSGSTRASRSSTSAAPRANVSEVMNIIGDVKGKRRHHRRRHDRHRRHAEQRRRRCMEAGARAVVGLRHHAVLSRPGDRAHRRIRRSRSCIVTNTIPLRPEAQALPEDQAAARVARLLGEAIKRIHHGDSISSLVHLKYEQERRDHGSSESSTSNVVASTGKGGACQAVRAPPARSRRSATAARRRRSTLTVDPTELIKSLDPVKKTQHRARR